MYCLDMYYSVGIYYLNVLKLVDRCDYAFYYIADGSLNLLVLYVIL
jgi:hypothetical protein